MSDLIVKEPLASQLRQQAEAQGMTPEEFLEAAMRRARFEANRRAIEDESAWWRGAAPSLRAQYAGEFVAVHNHSVVDHDPDEEVLRKRIRDRFGYIPILLTPAEGQREYRIVSTRLTRI